MTTLVQNTQNGGSKKLNLKITKMKNIEDLQWIVNHWPLFLVLGGLLIGLLLVYWISEKASNNA
jgi:hypothetical protein